MKLMPQLRNLFEVPLNNESDMRPTFIVLPTQFLCSKCRHRGMSNRWKRVSINVILLQKFSTKIRPILRKSIIRKRCFWREIFFFSNDPIKTSLKSLKRNLKIVPNSGSKSRWNTCCVTSDQRAETQDETDSGKKRISNERKRRKVLVCISLLRKDLFASKLRVRKYFIWKRCCVILYT